MPLQVVNPQINKSFIKEQFKLSSEITLKECQGHHQNGQVKVNYFSKIMTDNPRSLTYFIVYFSKEFYGTGKTFCMK